MLHTEKRIEHLTSHEKKLLSHKVIGYGNLKAAAEITGLHKHTIRNVNLLGYGYPETIRVIRQFISGEQNTN